MDAFTAAWHHSGLQSVSFTSPTVVYVCSTSQSTANTATVNFIGDEHSKAVIEHINTKTPYNYHDPTILPGVC